MLFSATNLFQLSTVPGLPFWRCLSIAVLHDLARVEYNKNSRNSQTDVGTKDLKL